jgi:Flp pilus assembly protein TadD
VALKHLARIAQFQEKWEEASRGWEAYQRVQPGDPDGYRGLAGLALREGRSEQARALLERLYRLDAADPTVPRQIGELYLAAGDPKAAAAWLLRAAHIDAYDVETYKHWGEACRGIEQWADAETAYKAVCVLAPEEPDGYRGLADVYESWGKAADAEECRRKARLYEVKDE